MGFIYAASKNKKEIKKNKYQTTAHLYVNKFSEARVKRKDWMLSKSSAIYMTKDNKARQQ